MLELLFFKKNQSVTKRFKNKDKMDRFINRKKLTTYVFNGWWHIIVKEGHK